jgi:hypothetical protein
MSRTATEIDDSAMAIDGMGNIVLLNSTHMKVYGRNGRLLRVVRVPSLPGLTRWSTRFVSAAVDGAGNVVALDDVSAQIVVLSAAGELVRLFGEGMLYAPTDVAIGEAGSVFVTDVGPDRGPDRIVVFSAVGVFLRAFGEQGKGKLCLPMRVAVDGAGNVCVADWQLNGPRIVVFSAAGEFVRAFTHHCARNIRAMDMAVDGSGNFYLMDVDNRRIGVFSAAGELIGNLGAKQRQVDEIRSPSRMEVGPAGSRLSADTLEMRRKLVEELGPSPNDIFGGEIRSPGRLRAGTLKMRRKLRAGMYDVSFRTSDICGGEIPFPRLVVDSAGSVFVRHFEEEELTDVHLTLFEQPIRLNEAYERQERAVALLMGSHERLGKPSKLHLLDPELLKTIWEALEDTRDPFRDTFNESASRVRIM